MKIRMQLLSDTIFGNGLSVPGGENLSVLQDSKGFPYYKGSTFKGIFREELTRLLLWKLEAKEDVTYLDKELKKKRLDEEKDVWEYIELLLGISDHIGWNQGRCLVFSDFVLSDVVKDVVKREVVNYTTHQLLDLFTHTRVFTSVTEKGSTKDGSLRECRCVNKGLIFYGTIECIEEDQEIVREVLSLMKWIGSMRNRGFGKVDISVIDE